MAASLKRKSIEQSDIRLLAESNFVQFVKLINPKQVVGSIHEELGMWMTRQDRKDHQLILMPRDHGKSRWAGYYALWELTRDPTKRILYISNTSTLAEKQLGWIKDLMQTSIYRRYWPEMTHEDDAKRKRWTTTEIAVDHPKRAAEGIRDPSIMVAGLTTSIVGLHFDIAILDDVVTGDNAYTEEGRDKVARQYSFLASIEGANAREVVVGTRYHPKDLYNEMLTMSVEQYDSDGNIIGKEPVYEIFERQVEDRGDRTGQYLWPRQQRSDGQWFGFDATILNTKFAKYVDKTQFYAQYYNNPNDSTDSPIKRSNFQYYEPMLLKHKEARWYYNGKRLNIIASADFAYTQSKTADYTAIAVVGIDQERNYYILDIDRYKTKLIKDQYEHIMNLHTKWDFSRMVIEATSAAEPIVEELKNQYFKPNGLMIKVEMVKPTRHEGTKEERMAAVLHPRYQNMSVYHYRGGNCQVLEDELAMKYPPHDDCKDAVASAMQFITAPTVMQNSFNNVITLSSHPKFGGIR